MGSCKYLGAPSDPGEWWCDCSSEAEDLGPGVCFSLRVGEDGGDGPHLVCCYGLREDVILDRVVAEAGRLAAKYQQPTNNHPTGRRLQGPIHVPSVGMWRSLDDILAMLPECMARLKRINSIVGRGAWTARNAVDNCTGYGAMSARVIELMGGQEALAKMWEVA